MNLEDVVLHEQKLSTILEVSTIFVFPTNKLTLFSLEFTQ